MTSEFQLLSDKVVQLAALASSLRQENVELRLHLRALSAEKNELGNRIDAAHARVAAVLESLPVTAEPEAQADADTGSDDELDADPDTDLDAAAGDTDSDSESEAAA